MRVVDIVESDNFAYLVVISPVSDAGYPDNTLGVRNNFRDIL